MGMERWQQLFDIHMHEKSLEGSLPPSGRPHFSGAFSEF